MRSFLPAFIFLGLAFGGTAAPAQRAASVELAPEQAVAVRLGGKGEATVVRRTRAEWSPFDVAVARHLAGQPTPDAPVPYADPLPSGPAMPEPAPVERGLVSIRFMAIAGRHSLLVLENGYDQALVYRARMTRDGESRATDVCVVIPQRRSYEHWPHPIERLTLTDFRLVPWQEGQPMRCE